MWFATERLGSLTSLAQVSLPRVFWIFFGGPGPCGTGPPSPLERIPAPPLVTTMLIAPNSAQPPGSTCMGVICALVFSFPSEDV